MKKITYGQAASEGTVSGKIYFTTDDIIEHSKLGEKVILVKKYTTPEDTLAIQYADGVMTEVGGLMSHAAICAREFNKPCIINCIGIDIDEKAKHLNTIDSSYIEGTMVTLDCYTGNVYMKGGNE